MNLVVLMGRLTRDPEVRYSQNSRGEQMAIARFSLAVDRRGAGKEGPSADFLNCTAFGKLGEFAEKYCKQGTKLVLTGHIQNDNYTNKNGEKVYTVQIIADRLEFAESKKSQENTQNEPTDASPDGFMSIPDDIMEGIPFK